LKTPRFYRYNISRIQPRGVFLAERLKEILEKEYQTPEIQLGYLDILF
jgi:pyrimidine operon attenuation protein/uracil phosphoribosyltransferase